MTIVLPPRSRAFHGFSVNNGAKEIDFVGITGIIGNRTCRPVDKADSPCNGKSPPHCLTAEEAAGVVGELVGDFDDRIGEPLLFRPRFSDDDVDTLRDKEPDKRKRTPPEYRLYPSEEILRLEKGFIPPIKGKSYLWIADCQPVWQVVEEEITPLIFWRGEIEGVHDDRGQREEHVVGHEDQRH